MVWLAKVSQPGYGESQQAAEKKTCWSLIDANEFKACMFKLFTHGANSNKNGKISFYGALWSLCESAENKAKLNEILSRKWTERESFWCSVFFSSFLSTFLLYLEVTEVRFRKATGNSGAVITDFQGLIA